MTLQRVLEPEVMDTFDEARDYDAMDHSQVNQQFVTDLLAIAALPEPSEDDDDDDDVVEIDVLDLGTGTAQIPIELCRRCETCRVMAVDLSVNMLDLARYNLEVAGLTQRITLQQIDAKGLPYEDGAFQIVMSNSIVHHIPEPLDALRHAVRATAAGGLLYFRDLMRPTDDATVEHLVQTYAGEENDHQRQMFDDSLRAALSLDEIRDLVSQLGFDPQTVTASSDRHWTWSARKD